MIPQPEREQLNRLTVKPLDQVFIMRAKEGWAAPDSKPRPSPIWALSPCSSFRLLQTSG